MFCIRIALIFLLAIIVTGCSGGTKEAVESTAPVARIVVVDLQFACDCTLEKVEATTAALDAVNGPDGLPVETIHMDTEEEAAEPFLAQRPVMVVPAVYFLYDQDRVVHFFQGEVSEEKIRTALGRTG